MTYGRLLDAMDEGCPVCQVVGWSAERLIDTLLYEHVNDPETRRRFRESLGFCNRHAWQARAHGDAIGQTILYEDLMTRVAERMMSGALPVASSVCAVCREEDEVERQCLVEFMSHVADAEVQRRYRDSGGLCLPHLSSALAGTQETGPRLELLKMEQAVLGLLLDDLTESKRQFDYLHAGVQPGRERGAWVRAIAKLYGAPGVRVRDMRASSGRAKAR